MRVSFDGGNPLRRRRDRIVAKMHRRRARVVSPAQKRELQSALPGDDFDHGERPSQLLQNWSLLDMKFHVTQNIVFQRSLRNLSGIQAKIFNGPAHGNPPRILSAQEFLIETPGQSTAADERGAEANAFFLGKTHNFNSERKPSSIQSLQQ